MNLSAPVVIGHKNEDFRTLLRDMLTKHGFFHVLEAASAEEFSMRIKAEDKSSLLLVDSNLVDESLLSGLNGKSQFLIIIQPDDTKALKLAAKFGVKHFISFPFSSQLLIERIRELPQ